MKEAESLVRDYPNFQLANLVLGDLLSVYTRPIRQIGDVPDTKAIAAAKQLEVLREQSRRRLRALTERPPENSVPSQFLALSTQSKHAIAVDASRSRLYLFENRQGPESGSPGEMKLVGDYYISVGLSGVEKTTEGDLRTPVGVYYITSSLDASKLPDLYGAGALPINYPNALDLQRGKTGSGIWLHGSPSEQFARPRWPRKGVWFCPTRISSRC
ncbi:MAG: L,D-transpeptidase family protein [Burkholderiaceae bacterium]